MNIQELFLAGVPAVLVGCLFAMIGSFRSPRGHLLHKNRWDIREGFFALIGVITFPYVLVLRSKYDWEGHAWTMALRVTVVIVVASTIAAFVTRSRRKRSGD